MPVDQVRIEVSPPQAGPDQTPAYTAVFMIYLVAFVVGAIVMSFEMLGSRYLNPYFGSGIYTWASLISTVLVALTIGYFLGGWLADRTASAPVLGTTVLIGSAYILALPLFAAGVLDLVLNNVNDIRAGSLLSALAIMVFPVTLLGMYSPFAIRLLLRSPHRSGMVSGTVYGISTAGSIVGTLGTTFFLIPSIGSRAITLTLGIAGLICGLVLVALPRLARRSAGTLALAACGPLLAGLALAGTAQADDLIDAKLRENIFKGPNGRIAHIETEYNDIFITKRRDELTMSFQLKGWNYTESVTNLRDPDELPVAYARMMTVATIYPQPLKKILMLGLGGGSISTYLGRFIPDVQIDTVEVDPGVINAAKKYFGIRETPRVRYFDGDGRVFLNRSKERYDLILVDAFHGGYVPFHLLTKEFYTLIKSRLTPGGAAAFNVHEGTKLYHSTVRTLSDVFAGLELHPSGNGEMIAIVTAEKAPDKATLTRRADALQQRYKFRYALPKLLEQRLEYPLLQAANGELITDDFAPVNLYGATGGREPTRK